MTISAEAYAYHEQNLRERPEMYGMHTRLRLLHGLLYTAADFVQAQRVRSVVRDAWTAAMRACGRADRPDLDRCRADLRGLRRHEGGHRAVVHRRLESRRLPRTQRRCGFSSAGLPIGMQIVGAPFAEPTVFRVGDAYQRITDWHTRAPEIDLAVEVTA